MTSPIEATATKEGSKSIIECFLLGDGGRCKEEAAAENPAALDVFCSGSINAFNPIDTEARRIIVCFLLRLFIIAVFDLADAAASIVLVFFLLITVALFFFPFVLPFILPLIFSFLSMDASSQLDLIACTVCIV